MPRTRRATLSRPPPGERRRRSFWPSAAARAGRGAALPARGAPPRRVLPVGGVQRDLPGVVPPPTEAPARRLRVEPAERAPQVGPVPRHAAVGFVERRQQQLHPWGAPPPPHRLLPLDPLQGQGSPFSIASRTVCVAGRQSSTVGSRRG